MEMHRNKYGDIFKGITYLLRRERKKQQTQQVGGLKCEYNVDFGNPYDPSSITTAFSPWRNVTSLIRSLHQMYPRLPLSYVFLTGRIDSSWTVL